MLYMHTGFPALLLLALCRCQAHNLRQMFWKKVFTVDVVAPGASLSTAADNVVDCVLHCLHLEDCKTWAFHQHSATCWLYLHLVYYTTTGLASPGTRYFWRLSPSCPEELGYQLEAGICLKIYASKVNWTTAEETCRSDGGHLLIADRAETRNAVLGRMSSDVWMGASDEHKEGEWRWVDGTLLLNDNWATGEPSNNGAVEHFLEMRVETGRFNDLPADELLFPSCQIPLH